jgi:hypothetical protein
MPIYSEQIAIAVETKIKNLPANPVALPGLIEWRMADIVHPGEAPCVIITIGGELPAEQGFQLQGAGTPSDYGSVAKKYLIGVSIYTACLGDLSTDVGYHPALVLRIKQAFDVPGLEGADTVLWCTLHENAAWEKQEFIKGIQVSRFVLEFTSLEPRNS